MSLMKVSIPCASRSIPRGQKWWHWTKRCVRSAVRRLHRKSNVRYAVCIGSPTSTLPRLVVPCMSTLIPSTDQSASAAHISIHTSIAISICHKPATAAHRSGLRRKVDFPTENLEPKWIRDIYIYIYIHLIMCIYIYIYIYIYL